MSLEELEKMKKDVSSGVVDESIVTGIGVANLMKLIDLAIIGVKSRDKQVW